MDKETPNQFPDSWDDLAADTPPPINSRMDAAMHCLLEYTHIMGGTSGHNDHLDLQENATELIACLIRRTREEGFDPKPELEFAEALSHNKRLVEPFHPEPEPDPGPDRD